MSEQNILSPEDMLKKGIANIRGTLLTPCDRRFNDQLGRHLIVRAFPLSPKFAKDVIEVVENRTRARPISPQGQ